MATLNIKDAQGTMLLEVDGQIYLLAMEREHLEAIEMLVKASVRSMAPTGRTQQELNQFLGYTGGV